MTAARKAREERRRRVAELLAEDPSMSDTAVALTLGVSDTTVANDRRALGIDSGVLRRQRLKASEGAGMSPWRLRGEWDSAEVVASCSICRKIRVVAVETMAVSCRCGRSMVLRAVLSYSPLVLEG